MNSILAAGRRALDNADLSHATSTMRWKVALWERNSIEPALLRVPLVVIFFLGLWAVNLWTFERCRVCYTAVLGYGSRSSPLSFTLCATMVLAVGYTLHMHACTQILGMTVEVAITIFYSALFCLVVILPAACCSNGGSGGGATGLSMTPLSTPHTHAYASVNGKGLGPSDKDKDTADADADTDMSFSGGSGTGTSNGGVNMNTNALTAAGVREAFMEHRASFLRLLRLIFFPGDSISFPEILLTDALTSLSKVFKDVGVTLVAIYAQSQGQPMVLYHEQGMLLVACLASLPAFLRIRQCLVQFHGTNDPTTKIAVFLNIVKYFTAFPPIWLTAASALGYRYHALPLMTAAFSTLNSVMSYLWDVVMDWGLVQLSWNAKHRMCICLRFRSVFFYPASSYFVAVCLNLVLRFSWMANQVDLFRGFHATQLVLLVELLEVVRRAIWNVYRVEWEIINKTMKERSLSKADDEGGGGGSSSGAKDDFGYDDGSPMHSGRERDRERERELAGIGPTSASVSAASAAAGDR